MSGANPANSAGPPRKEAGAALLPGAEPITDELLCPACGYNLRGLTINRCPECGQDFDPADLIVSRIPWAHRRRNGRLRAYWQTVWLVMLRNRQFCRECYRPVRYTDAQKFRWVTVLHAYLPLLVGTLAFYLLGWDMPLSQYGLPASFDAWITTSRHLSVLLGIIVATGVPSYFFHPRSLPLEQQNRAVAMSYYAAAPLAWSPLLFLFDWAALKSFDSQTVFLLLAGSLVLIQLLAWWLCLVLIAGRSMQRSLGGMVMIAVVMPVVWVLAVALTMVGIDSTIRFLSMMYYSLRW